MADVTEAAVRLVVDERGFDAAFTSSVKRATSKAGKGLDDDMKAAGRRAGDGAGREFGDGFTRGADGRLRDSRGRFASIGQGARSAGEDAGRSFGDAFRTALAIDLAGKLVSSLAAPLKGLTFAGIGAGAAASAASLVQFTAALAPAVGILAGVPAAVGIAGAALATLKVGVSGVGDAFAAGLGGDAAAFEESLDGLAPAAADTARAFAALKPQLDELRASVQGALFAGFAEQLTTVASVLLGPLQQGMTGAAASMNSFVIGLAGIAGSAQGVTFIQQSFASLQVLIGNLTGPLLNLTASLLNVGNAVGAAFGGDQLGAGLGELINQFASFLDQAAASGQAVSWVQGAIAVFSQLGAILVPIGSIFASIGQAASQTGGDILGVFGTLAQGLADFLGSVEGQDFLVQLFTTLGVLGDALLPIFTAAGSAIAGILPSISGILQALAPAAELLVQGLGAGLQALAPALIPLASAIASIVGALTPLLPVVGQILGMVAGVAADLLSAIAPLVSILVSSLMPIFRALMPLILMIADILLGVLTPALSIVGMLFQALSPFLVQIVQIFSAAFLPLLQMFGEILSTLLPPLGELVLVLIEAFMPIVMAILPLVLQLATLFSDLLLTAIQALLPVIVMLIEYFAWQVRAAMPVISVITQLASWLVGGLVDGISTAIDWIGGLIGWFADLGADIGDFVSSAIDHIGGFASDVGDFFSDIGDWIDDLVGWFRGLPGKILGYLEGLGEDIWNSITSGLSDLGDWIGLANGGIVTRATPAIVGEAGAEAVIPLTRPARALQLMRASGLDRLAIANAGGSLNPAGSEGDRPIVVNVHTTTLSPRIVQSKVEAALERALSGSGA